MAKLVLIAVIAAAVMITCQCNAADAPVQHVRISQTLGVQLPMRGAAHNKQQPAQQTVHRKLLASSDAAYTEDASFLNAPSNATSPSPQTQGNTSSQASPASATGCFVNCP